MSLRLKVLLLTILVQALLLAVTADLLFHQSGKVKQHRACLAALRSPQTGVEPVKVCEPIIATSHQVAARSSACEAALAARPENIFGVRMACSAPIKSLFAQRDVAQAEAGHLAKALNDERLGRGAAIARAQLSATTQAERKARAAAAVQAAPRDGDGLIRCDAECVRERWAGADAERP
ncbi:hypothetical protein [Caulobacter henricii]|uniref:Uncharacterized protein n=1 Tax=Caulobacter henricii TaxID=69395 RepID=A0A0P0P1Z4_9CAUL|nr:hypothetical protein [Caulobacter henricii]ALL14277.1 hypothetical protein AQ619_13505 [Caulobacter henricii]